jgi:hypothetical protein
VGVRVGFTDCSEICRKQEVRLASMTAAERSLNLEKPIEVVPVAAAASSGTRFPSNVEQFAVGVSWFCPMIPNIVGMMCPFL